MTRILQVLKSLDERYTFLEYKRSTEVQPPSCSDQTRFLVALGLALLLRLTLLMDWKESGSSCGVKPRAPAHRGALALAEPQVWAVALRLLAIAAAGPV